MSLILPQRGRLAQAAGGAGVVEFIGWAEGWNATLTDQNPDLTSLTTDSYGIGGSLQENDLVITVHSAAGSGGTSNFSPSWSGYTQIADVYSNDTLDTNLAAAYKFMGGTPDTVVDVTSNGFYGNVATSLTDHVIALCFRGVDTTTPLDVTVTTNTATNTGDIDAPAITPVTSGSIVVSLVGGCGASGFTSTIGLPGGVDYEQGISAYGTTSSYLGAVGWAMVDNWASGAVDIGTFTNVGNYFSSNGKSAAAITIALRPA